MSRPGGHRRPRRRSSRRRFRCGCSRRPTSGRRRGAFCRGRIRPAMTRCRRSGLARRRWRGRCAAARRPLAEMASAPGAGVEGLRLLDGGLLLKIARGGRVVRLLLGGEERLPADAGVAVVHDFGLRMPHTAERLYDFWAAAASDRAAAGSPSTVTVAPTASDAFNGARGFSLSRFALPQVARAIATRVVHTSHEAAEPAEPADFRFWPGTARATARGRSAGDPVPARLLSDGAQGSLAQDRDRRPQRAILSRHRQSPCDPQC